MRTRLPFVLALVVVLGAGVPSQAAVNTAAVEPGGFVAGFATPVIVLDRSAPVAMTLTNLDILEHNLVSRATRGSGQNERPLFSTETIPLGVTTPIVLLNNVAPGTYDFVCTLHADTMIGIAVVR